MTFSAAISPMLSRPSSYADQILKTPSMRGYVQVTEVTEQTAAPTTGVDSAAFPVLDATQSEQAKRGQFQYVASPGEGMTKMQVCTSSYVPPTTQGGSDGVPAVWSPVARALKVTLFENDSYVPDDDSTRSYRFYAAVDAPGAYRWRRGPGSPAALVLDPQLFGLFAQADDWDRVDSSAIEALTSTARW